MSEGPADKAFDVFKDLVFDQLVSKAISQVVGLAPFLSWGPIAFLVGKAINYVAGIIYEEMKDFINFQVILLNNRAHHLAYIEAHIALNKTATEMGIDSDEFKIQREIHKAALSRFVRYDT